MIDHPAPPAPKETQLAEPTPRDDSHAPTWFVLLFHHRTSDFPSPSKSPTPAIVHPAPPVPKETQVVSPFGVDSQAPTCTWPPLASCQRMSVFLSPLKSPTPAIVQP